jgi:hypothetical protein
MRSSIRAKGRPIAFHLTPGQAADCKAYKELIDTALLADKAYDTNAIRNDLRRRRIKDGHEGDGMLVEQLHHQLGETRLQVSVGSSPTTRNHTAETALAGWGARIRTWEWRNQNPPIPPYFSMIILKNWQNSTRFQSMGWGEPWR